VPNIVFVSGLPIIDCPIGNFFFRLPDQAKDYNNDIYCFPAKYGVKAKTGCLGIRIMCLDEVICLTAVSYHYTNPTKRVGLVHH